MYLLLNMMIFHCHVNFWGCTNTLFISNSFDCLRHWFLWLEHFAQSLCSETRRLTCMTCLTWFIMPTFTNCSNQQKLEDRLHILDFSSPWLWTYVPSTHLESIWTKFSRTCRGLRCIFDSSGGFISPQQNPPPQQKSNLFNGRRPWRVRNGKKAGFLGSLIRWAPRMSSPCGIIKES